MSRFTKFGAVCHRYSSAMNILYDHSEARNSVIQKLNRGECDLAKDRPGLMELVQILPKIIYFSKNYSDVYGPIDVKKRYADEEMQICYEMDDYMKNSESEFIRQLEADGLNAVKKSYSTVANEGFGKAADGLAHFMSTGASDFKKKFGREMTYSEMRAAWG